MGARQVMAIRGQAIQSQARRGAGPKSCTPTTRTWGLLSPEVEAVAHLDLEPGVHLVDALEAGVLDRYPTHLSAAAPPLCVAGVVVCASVFLGVLKAVYLDQHRMPVPDEQEVWHPDVSSSDTSSRQWRDGERTVVPSRSLKANQRLVDGQLFGVREVRPSATGDCGSRRSRRAEFVTSSRADR